MVSELSHAKIIIAFGKHAKKALKKVKAVLSNRIYIGARYHLGMQGINHIRHDFHKKKIKKNTPNATQLRLKVIADEIWDAIQKGGNL